MRMNATWTADDVAELKEALARPTVDFDIHTEDDQPNFQQYAPTIYLDADQAAWEASFTDTLPVISKATMIGQIDGLLDELDRKDAEIAKLRLMVQDYQEQITGLPSDVTYEVKDLPKQ